MTVRRQSVVICEGYHDRAFWTGWLESLGCQNLGAPRARQSGPYDILDPWGGKVVGGQFAFLTGKKEFLRIVPCGGKNNVPPAMENYLKTRAVEPIRQLVVTLDADTEPPAGLGEREALLDLKRRVQKFDSEADFDEAGDLLCDGGTTIVSLLQWRACDAHTAGLPRKQTLERLVSSAIIAAYPERAQPVQDWLESRTGAATGSPKEYAWSYMAGWYADHWCDDFYRALWRDDRLVHELKVRLSASSAWRIAEGVAQ